ncbi:MAG: AAA family ATPase [Saprospiraceae bacterium]|nr:AAA family ATPase [Saprospiraceae bacterium]
MIIQRLILKNWKNFQKADFQLATRNFIVGANASGKSNLLDVFRFLRDLVKQAGGLQYAVEERGGVSKLRCLSARAESDISIEIHLGDGATAEVPKWKYLLTFKHTGGGFIKNEAIVVEEKVWSHENNAWVLERNGKGAEDNETRKFTYLEQINSNAKFREVYFFLRDIQYLHLIPQLVRDAESYFLAANKEDFYGRNLLERIAVTPKKTRDSYLRRISEVLQIAVPQLSELTFLEKKDDPSGIPHLEARYKHWRPSGAKQTERQFSDGTLRLIGFMWALLDGKETILLEEPELYLHAEIVKQLPEFISKMQRRKNGTRQVVITTHSYDLLNTLTISPKEVLVLETGPEGTTVKPADSIELVKNYLDAGFTPAEAITPLTAPKEIKKITQLNLFD